MTANKKIETPEEEEIINAILSAQKEYDTNAAPIILKYENAVNEGIAIYAKEIGAGHSDDYAEETASWVLYPARNEYWAETAKVWDKYLETKEKWGWDANNFHWETSRKILRPRDLE